MLERKASLLKPCFKAYPNWQRRNGPGDKVSPSQVQHPVVHSINVTWNALPPCRFRDSIIMPLESSFKQGGSIQQQGWQSQANSFLIKVFTQQHLKMLVLLLKWQNFISIYSEILWHRACSWFMMMPWDPLKWVNLTFHTGSGWHYFIC